MHLQLRHWIYRPAHVHTREEVAALFSRLNLQERVSSIYEIFDMNHQNNNIVYFANRISTNPLQYYSTLNQKSTLQSIEHTESRLHPFAPHRQYS